MGRPWGVFYDDFEENLLRYNGTAEYIIDWMIIAHGK